MFLDIYFGQTKAVNHGEKNQQRLTFQCREDGIFLRRYSRHSMRLQHFTGFDAFPRTGLGTLICEREWRFTNERKHDLCLIAYQIKPLAQSLKILEKSSKKDVPS